MRTTGRPLVGILLLMLLVCPMAYSQDREAAREASFTGWTFDVAPFYLWIPALDGTVTVRGLSTDVDLSVGDTLDLLFDSFKFVATGRAEARKGNTLLALDLMYLNLEENTQTDIGLGVEQRFKQLILEFGGGYHLLDWSLPGDGLPRLSVDLLAGGRFVHLDSGLTIEGLRVENRVDVDRSKDWIEPFLGAPQGGHHRPAFRHGAGGYRRLRSGLAFHLECGDHPGLPGVPAHHPWGGLSHFRH